MNLGAFGDPITPVMKGISSLATRWPAITTVAIIDYTHDMVRTLAPPGGSIGSTLISYGVEGAFSLIKLGAWDEVKKQYP